LRRSMGLHSEVIGAFNRFFAENCCTCAIAARLAAKLALLTEASHPAGPWFAVRQH